MKKILFSHRLFFILYLVFVISSSYVLFRFNTVEIHQFFNGFHSPGFDQFFKYLTYAGDGISIVLVTLIALFHSKRWALQIGASGIISGIIAQTLKKVVFGPTPRPSKYFSDLDLPLYYVPGVELHTAFSFPSGHTTAVFALISSLMFLYNKIRLDLIWLGFALLAAYSRIYLSQHFLADVLLGSFIGISVSIIVYLYLFRSSFLKKNKWDNPLITFPKK